MNQIAQISKSLQKQLERCENIDTNEVDIDNSNIFDDKFIEDQLKQIDERTKSLADIDTRALNSLQLSPARQAKYPTQFKKKSLDQTISSHNLSLNYR